MSARVSTVLARIVLNMIRLGDAFIDNATIPKKKNVQNPSVELLSPREENAFRCGSKLPPTP